MYEEDGEVEGEERETLSSHSISRTFEQDEGDEGREEEEEGSGRDSPSSPRSEHCLTCDESESEGEEGSGGEDEDERREWAKRKLIPNLVDEEQYFGDEFYRSIVGPRPTDYKGDTDIRAEARFWYRAATKKLKKENMDIEEICGAAVSNLAMMAIESENHRERERLEYKEEMKKCGKTKRLLLFVKEDIKRELERLREVEKYYKIERQRESEREGRILEILNGQAEMMKEQTRQLQENRKEIEKMKEVIAKAKESGRARNVENEKMMNECKEMLIEGKQEVEKLKGVAERYESVMEGKEAEEARNKKAINDYKDILMESRKEKEETKEALRRIKEDIKARDGENKKMMRECKEMLKESKQDMVEMKEEIKSQKATLERIENEGVASESNTETIEECKEMLRESKQDIGNMKRAMERQKEGVTYAKAVAHPAPRKPGKGVRTHSIAVTSLKKGVTGEEVMEMIKETVNAREEGLQIERIRKAKDKKVIIGCRTKEELQKVRAKIEKGKNLKAEEMKNKDPLIIMKDVTASLKDKEILDGLRLQNSRIFEGVEGEEDRIEVKYRRKTRNPLTQHVVITVSPKIWAKMTEAGAVHIDVHKVKVADQSPLIQCSRCLGYGHGKRFCRESVDLCGHCGGPHMRTQCDVRKRGHAPTCVNCKGSGLDLLDHDAFSNECPVRNRWDALARSTVQYS